MSQPHPYNLPIRFTSADWGSDLDLLNVPGAPQGVPPDQIDILNVDGDPQSIVFSLAELPNGVTPDPCPFTVAPGTVRVVFNTKIAGVVNAGTGTIEEITCYWRVFRETVMTPTP